MKVALLDDYQGVALDHLARAGSEPRARYDVFEDHVDDPDVLVTRLRPYEAVVAMRERTPFGRDVLSRLPNLELLVTTGPRNAVIDEAACAEFGITLCGTGGSVQSTAELTWALILAAARHLPEEVANVRGGGWMTTVGTDLHGATLGLLGLGRIGSMVATVGSAFGMRLVAWSQNLTRERCAEFGAELVEREQLFEQADFLSVHLVLSERTRGLVGGTELARMKPTAWLVNTSRGPICDEAALAAACAGGIDRRRRTGRVRRRAAPRRSSLPDAAECDRHAAHRLRLRQRLHDLLPPHRRGHHRLPRRPPRPSRDPVMTASCRQRSHRSVP